MAEAACWAGRLADRKSSIASVTNKSGTGLRTKMTVIQMTGIKHTKAFLALDPQGPPKVVQGMLVVNINVGKLPQANRTREIDVGSILRRTQANCKIWHTVTPLCGPAEVVPSPMFSGKPAPTGGALGGDNSSINCTNPVTPPRAGVPHMHVE